MARLYRYFQSLIRQPAFQLAVLAGISLLVYWQVFVRPAHLVEIYPSAKPHFYYLFGFGSSEYYAVVLGFIVTGVLYLFGWRIAGQARGKAAWLVVCGAPLAFAAVLTFLYPYDAADIFDYIIHGRTTSVYGLNPYRHIPKELPGDPFFNLVAWKSIPSPYGPVWELFASLTSFLAGDGIVANVIAFKLVSGIFLLASQAVIAIILRRAHPESALAGTLLLAWNPVVLYETWGNGHNDMVMVFWLLAAVWALQSGRYTLGVLAVLASALVKFVPILLLPAALAVPLGLLPNIRSRAAFLIRTGLAGALFVALFYAPFWEGPQVLTFLKRDNLFTSSLPASVYHILLPNMPNQAAARLVSQAAFGLTASFAFWQAWRLTRAPSWQKFAQAGFNIMAFFLLVTCLWFQQWYTLWLLALAPVLRSPQARNLAILFGFSALSKQFLAGPWLFYPQRRLPQPEFEIVFTLGVLGPAWIYALFTIWRMELRPAIAASLARAGRPLPAPTGVRETQASEPKTPVEPNRAGKAG